MKKKNGFTLIELLAVIVILAIIALIAIPQVMKILNQARKSAAEDTTYGIYSATEDYVSKAMLSNGGDFPSGELTFTCDNTSCKLDNYASLTTNGFSLEETLDYKGAKVKGGKIKISNNGTDIVIENLKVNEFSCSYSNEKATCEKGESSSGEKIIGTLAANVHVGDYIEYDPTAGVLESEVDKLLKYTSPVGELKVYSGSEESKVYAVNETGTTFNYNGAYNLINEDGNIVLSNGSIIGTDNVTYIIENDEHGNGCSNQNFQATSNNNIWRVLDVDTATGVVKIVPENLIQTSDSSPDNFCMSGLRGYKNLSIELNNISSIFGHGTGANVAQSITMDDINKITGYNPSFNSVDFSMINTQNGQVKKVKTWKNSSYSYSKDDYQGENSNITNMIYKNYYWLATTSMSVETSQTYFQAVLMQESGNSNYYLYGVAFTDYEFYNSGGSPAKLGIMPVVTLKANTNYKSGDGTSSSSDKIIKFQ